MRALLRAPGDFAALPAAMMPLLRSRTTKRVVLATGAGKRSALLGLRANDASLPVSHLGAVTVVTDQLLKRTGDTT